MAATKVTPAPVTGISFNGGVGGSGGGGLPNNGLTASELNDFRISSVIDRLFLHVRGNRKSEAGEFTNLCYSLSRGIDFATANHQVPSRTQELASIVKQVCRTQGDAHLQAAILSLMVSVKSACQCGWFSAGDSEELSNLAKEVFSKFGIVCNTDPSCFHLVISTIMSRFYPRMKMGHIFAFLEVKPGYDAYLADFLITKNLKSSPGDKILGLFLLNLTAFHMFLEIVLFFLVRIVGVENGDQTANLLLKKGRWFHLGGGNVFKIRIALVIVGVSLITS